MAKAPRVSVKFEVDSTGYSAAVNKAKAQMIDFGEASKRVHRTMITDVQATSGTLRLLDGGIQNNIRSAERFLANIKGVGPALQAIYPGVGLIAVGAVIARGVTELTAFIKKAREAGQEWQDSAQRMANATRLSNDELARTNIELENQLAKLTGRHENVLAAQLIDARIEADKLADSAAAAAKEIKDLLKENQPGIFGQLVLGRAGTGDVVGNANNFEKLIKQSMQDFSDARNRGDQGAAAGALAQARQYATNAQAYTNSQIGQLEKAPPAPSTGSRLLALGKGVVTGNIYGAATSVPLDYSQKIQDLRALRTRIDAMTTQITESEQGLTDKNALQKAQDSKNVADKYRDAQEKAARKLKQDMDAQLDAMKLGHELSVAEESQYWHSALEAVKGGSQPMLALRVEINKRLAELAQEQFRNLAKWQDQDVNGNPTGRVKVSESLKPETDERSIHDQARIAEEQNAALEKAGIAAARQQAAYEEAVVTLRLATGELSKLDAAQQSAAIHAKEYAAEIAAIQASLKFWASAPDSPEKTRGIAEGSQQLSDIGSAQKLSGMEDKARIYSETPLGAWKESLDLFVQQSKDAASQVRDIWSSALSGVNEEIVKIISTRHNYNTRVEFGNLGAGMFRNVAGAALQKGEGALLGAFGLGGGKPDGTESKPLHVIIAGSKHAIAGAGAGVTGMVKGAVSDAGGWLGKVGGFASKIFSGLGFADGGMPPVGMASVVGERGPELFVPSVAGSIVPSDQLGGGNVSHTFHIDARGASDPAAVHAAVQRGIAKAMPQIAAATTHAQQSGKMRMPSSRRS